MKRSVGFSSLFPSVLLEAHNFIESFNVPLERDQRGNLTSLLFWKAESENHRALKSSSRSFSQELNVGLQFPSPVGFFCGHLVTLGAMLMVS